jgi:hypothetical protein
MTDKLAIWLSGGSLLVSFASFVLAAKAKQQAQKAASLAPRTDAINNVREALHDLNQYGTVKAETADSVRKAIHLSDLVFSSKVRKELDQAYATAYRLQEIRRLSDQDARDIVALRLDLQTLLAHMNQEATLIGWSAPWRWLRSSG